MVESGLLGRAAGSGGAALKPLDGGICWRLVLSLLSLSLSGC